eukprot:TRINITY_DN10063_c0_g1_i5.p1 TRINITY_DN10063_c0_g1~~TRINITY_DN10063_c0_g1_i5.p1  ORF type:complete len:592 (+),score=142.23 TRINITY_DN10063_c0_g1_i5:169-1776(+)
METALRELETFEFPESTFSFEHVCSNYRILTEDDLIPPELAASLEKHLDEVANRPEADKDYHPGSNNKVLDLIHPSMFPFVKGMSETRGDQRKKSMFPIDSAFPLANGQLYVDDDHTIYDAFLQKMGTNDPDPMLMQIAWIPNDPKTYLWTRWNHFTSSELKSGKLHEMLKLFKNRFREKTGYTWGSLPKNNTTYHQIRYEVQKNVSFSRANEVSKYQWLPTTYCVDNDDKVSIVSYINNLNERKYPNLKRDFEQIFEKCLPTLWSCLYRTGIPLKEDTEFDTCDFELPDQKPLDQIYREAGYISPGEVQVEAPKKRERQDDHEIPWKFQHVDETQVPITEEFDSEYESDEETLPPTVPSSRNFKWHLTEEELKRRVDFTENSPEIRSRFEHLKKEADRAYHTELGRRPRYQVITKACNYVLRPGEEYEGTWHVEGMSHEKIVASILYYYYSSPHLQDAGLSFRGETGYHADSRPGGEKWKASRDLGTVRTCQGRVIAFPNDLQHKVAHIKNISETEIGYRKILCFFSRFKLKSI